MTDYTELKRLAEAAPEGPWFGPEYAPGTSYVFDVDLGTLLHYESIDTEQDTCLRYVAAANPAAVLALIAENERLSADCSSMRGSLKANAASIKKLIKDGGRAARERDQLKAENQRQAAQFKEWQASHHANYVSVAEERDQLRAEVAGLRTGYEAYEQVNTELKAENETLIAAAQALRDEWRKDQADAKRYRFLRNEASSRVQDYCIVKKFWGGTFPDRILVLDGADAEIDAALGQGEKS